MASPESQKHVQAYWDHGFVSAIPVVSPEEAADHRGHLESAEREMGHDLLHFWGDVLDVKSNPPVLTGIGVGGVNRPAMMDRGLPRGKRAKHGIFLTDVLNRL